MGEHSIGKYYQVTYWSPRQGKHYVYGYAEEIEDAVGLYRAAREKWLSVRIRSPREHIEEVQV